MFDHTGVRKVVAAYVWGLVVTGSAACSSTEIRPSTMGQAGESSSVNPTTGSASTVVQGQAGMGIAGARQTAAAGQIGAAATGGDRAPTAGSAAASIAGAAPLATGGSLGTAGTSGSAGAGIAGNAAGGMKGNAGASGTMDVPCNSADKTADAKPVEFATTSEVQATTPTGPYKAVMESDPGIATHTIIRPEPIGAIKHPILAWGEGGCRKSGNEAQNTNLFKEFASHGFLIIADGPAGTGPSMAGQDGKPLLFALDWARKENERPCSKYYHKLAIDKVAVSGQSCGGIMAFDAATDPKITTAFLYDSGLFARDPMTYNALHAPMAIFNGGSEDIAYANGMADFNAIDKIPILFANPTKCSSNAHVCTFFEPSAGQFGRAGVAWMRWHLLGDQGPTGKGMFVGTTCGLCGPDWKLQWKMEPM